MALTRTKKVFAEAVLAGKSNKAAAIAAGLSVKTASAAGTRLSKDKDVQAHLAKRRAEEFPKQGQPKSKDWPFGVADEQPAPQPKRISAEELLQEIVNDTELDVKVRLEAAKKLIEFEKPKPAPQGKKVAAKDAAALVGGGKFGAAPPPLRVVGK